MWEKTLSTEKGARFKDLGGGEKKKFLNSFKTRKFLINYGRPEAQGMTGVPY